MALSLLAGCLIEGNPEPPPPPPPPPPPGGVFELHGQLLDASGAPAPFVPVRLGGEGGFVVATDGAGAFVFSLLQAGEYTLYAYDPFVRHIGVATVDLGPGSEDVTVELRDCNEVLDEGPFTPEILDICFSDVGIDLPPDSPGVTIDAQELSAGSGYTNPYNTSMHVDLDAGQVRTVFFSMHDGFGRGGVREFTIEGHNLVGSDPVVDPFEDPRFTITLQDTNGHQIYSVRDGVFRLELEEGDSPTRSFVLTGTSLVLDYEMTTYTYDPGYTLTVPSVRLEGTLDVELPPPAPEGDLSVALEEPFILAEYEAGGDTLRMTLIDGTVYLSAIMLDTAQLALPGTVSVELPIGATPDLAGSSMVQLSSGEGLSPWDFQLVSYTVTTDMTALPGCDEQLTLTLEDLVFRYVAWEYDENSDRVDSFGDQTLTIDRIDVDTRINPNNDC